jgi:predicted DNA-binding ribbon-helix-helix protein
MDKKTSINIDPVLWNETKKLAIDRGVTTSQLIEDLIKSELQSNAKGERNGKRTK